MGNKAILVCSVSGCKILSPPATPLEQGMFRFVSPCLEVHKHILLQPCFFVFLLCPHPCCQIAPTLPYPVANNIPLFCLPLTLQAHTQLWFLIKSNYVKDLLKKKKKILLYYSFVLMTTVCVFVSTTVLKKVVCLCCELSCYIII